MKWVIYSFGVVVLGVLILVYEISGIKYFWEMSDFVNQKIGEEKVKLEKEVFSHHLSNL